MKYSDIAKALTKTLYRIFPNRKIYSIGRLEDIKRPAFYFYMKPVVTEPSNKRTRHNILSVYIDYFQKQKDEADIYDTATAIRDALGWSYPVPDAGGNVGYVDITDFDWDFVGRDRNVLEINITIEYFDKVDNDEHAETIESVDMDFILKEAYKE